MAKETAEQKLMKLMGKKQEPVTAKSKSIVDNLPFLNLKKFNFVFSIGALNKFLFIGILVCVIALIWEMRSGMSLLNQPVDFTSTEKSSVSLSDIALPSAKNVDYYLEKINGRNIFKPYDAQANVKASAGSQSLAKRLSKYKLVGVAWLDLPETASIMLEDSQAKQTYFLKQGEQLEGVMVKTIYTDRAVLRYENEEMTIKL